MKTYLDFCGPHALEFRSILKNKFNLYHTRISSQPNVTPDNLLKMEKELPFAVKLLPTSLDLSSVGYACTSGATIIGPKKIETIKVAKMHLGSADETGR